jgi:choline-sulfatase
MKLTVRRILAILLAGTLFKSATLPAAETPNTASPYAETRPNILLICIDDLNDWVGCLHGHPQAKTPNIDSLADRGTLFVSAYCQAPVCQPSRCSMMMSRLPSSTGLYFLNPGIRDSTANKGAFSIPERFAAEGYEVMGAGKLFHSTLNQQIFDQVGMYAKFENVQMGVGPRPTRKINQLHGHPLWDWGAFPQSDEQMPDFQIANWAATQLNQVYDKPFFMAVGFYRPHVPMYVPQKWFDMHPLDKIQLPEVLLDDVSDLSAYARDLTGLRHVAPSHQWVRDSGQWPRAVQSYLASSTFVDLCVGTVIDALNASKYRDNTIVVLFSDHGFHLGEKERWAKRSLWEDAARVPLIFAGPNIVSRAKSKAPVGLIDIFPTLLELAGLANDPQHEGQSLQPLLKNSTARWERPALTTFGPGNHAIRSTRYRYIRYWDGSQELYDHELDPHEWRNLARDPNYATIIERHQKWLPKIETELLGSGSTGHIAYEAAQAAFERRKNADTRGLKFRTQKLHHDLCETCAVGDIDNDQDIDVVAGEYWYSNPDWKQRKFRSIDVLKQGYLADNGDHLFDVNRDGCLDVVSGSFYSTTIHWFENPGSDNVLGANKWKQHELANTESGNNEITMMYDIDGDTCPELFVNSWNTKSPMSIWKFDAAPSQPLKRTTVSPSGNGHGQGFGDINGDGRVDIVFGSGWYEQPNEKPFDRRWKLHSDFELPNCSCPVLVVDLNRDGRNDLVWGNGHDYGLFWDEQLEPLDGSTRWRRHEIDNGFSQAHALAWADLDGDGNRELISGKRFHAHNGRDNGAADPIVMNYYQWNRKSESFIKFSISERTVGTGLQIRTADLNGDRRCDIVVSGKSGTYILWNEGL